MVRRKEFLMGKVKTIFSAIGNGLSTALEVAGEVAKAAIEAEREEAERQHRVSDLAQKARAEAAMISIIEEIFEEFSIWKRDEKLVIVIGWCEANGYDKVAEVARMGLSDSVSPFSSVFYTDSEIKTKLTQCVIDSMK
jgi:hypothetical protein